MKEICVKIWCLRKVDTLEMICSQDTYSAFFSSVECWNMYVSFWLTGFDLRFSWAKLALYAVFLRHSPKTFFSKTLSLFLRHYLFHASTSSLCIKMQTFCPENPLQNTTGLRTEMPQSISLDLTPVTVALSSQLSTHYYCCGLPLSLPSSSRKFKISWSHHNKEQLNFFDLNLGKRCGHRNICQNTIFNYPIISQGCCESGSR